MTRRVSRSSLALAGLVALGGCAEPAIEHPRLSVYRYRYDDGCYDPCQQDAVVDGSIATAPDELCDSPPTSCTFRPGRDRARIVVDYAGLSFDDAIPAIAITTLVDGEKVGTPIPLDGQHDEADGAFAVRELLVPLASHGELRFSVEVDGSFDAVSEAELLAEPSFSARFRSCEGLELCELAAGAGTATVVLDVPRGLDQVELVSTVGGIIQGGPLPIPVTGNPGEDLVVEVPIPDRASTVWALTPRSGSYEDRTPATATLVTRPPLELGAVAIDADAETMVSGGFPRRIALEPNPGCRRVRVVARNPRALGGQRVTLVTTQGSFDDRGTSVELAFDEQGLASAELDLGDELIVAGEVRISAESAVFGKVEQRWRLASLLPETAELFIPGSPQQLGEQGTPDGVTVTGLLRPPAALLIPSLPAGFEPPRFSPGTTATVIVEATTLDNAPVLACGTPLPDENIDCDRSGSPNVPQGGCAWTPTAIAVAPDGGFQLELPGDQCFTGDVKFHVVSPAYTGAFDIDACVGEQLPEPVGTAAPISETETLTYIATP